MPVAAGRIHQQRRRGVGAIARGVAGQSQADVILGEQDAPGARHGVRFVPLQPQQFGRRETRHGAAADDVGEVRETAMQLGAFGRCPAVVPQQGRPDGRVGGIEQSDAQHLARQADAAHGRHRCRRFGRQGVEAVDDRLPPILRRLLRPQRLGVREGQRCAGRRHRTVIVVHDDGLDARRADVDAEIHSTVSRCRAGCRARRARRLRRPPAPSTAWRAGRRPGSPSCSSRLKPRWTWRCRAASRRVLRSRAG